MIRVNTGASEKWKFFLKIKFDFAVKSQSQFSFNGNASLTPLSVDGHGGSVRRYHIVNYVRYRPGSGGVATAVDSNVIELSSGTARLLNFP